MALYRKKPLEVEAAKWTGDPAAPDLLDLIAKSKGDILVGGVGRSGMHLDVVTIDGNRVTVPVGAYLVLDGKGWPYPCDAELFEAGHDPVPAPGDSDWLAVFEGTDGGWYWHRKAPNGQPIAQGEGYTREADAVTGALRANPDLSSVSHP